MNRLTTRLPQFARPAASRTTRPDRPGRSNTPARTARIVQTARAARAAVHRAARRARATTARAWEAVTAHTGWSLWADRYQLAVTPVPRSACRMCGGAGGWWVGGPHPEMEPCPCWASRREHRIPIRRRPAWYSKPPF